MKSLSSIIASLLILSMLLTGCSIFSSSTDESTENGSNDISLPSGETDGESGTSGEQESAGAEMYNPDPSESAIPVVSVTTEDEKPITSRTRYKNATVTITGAPYAHHNVTLTAQIRGRGHSSFDNEAEQDEYASKNSYRLKLDEKSNLLGIGETADKDWVLISCKYDISALRNEFIWNLADRLGTIPYVPSGTWVNLYVNGQ